MNKNINKDPFESFIKDSLENHTVDYKKTDWLELEEKLNNLDSNLKNNTPNTKGNSGALLKGLGLLLIVSVATYLVIDNTNEDTTVLKVNKNNEKQVTQNEQTNNHTIIEKEILPPTDINIIDTKKPETSKINSSTKINTTEKSISENKEIIFEEKPSKTVKSNPLPLYLEDSNKSTDLVIDFTYTYLSKCEESEVSFITSDSDKGYEYIWIFGDGNTSKDLNPNHTYKPGVYHAKLRGISKSDGTIFESNPKDIIINKAPKAEFKWDSNTSGAVNYAVSFIDKSEGATQYSWNFGDREFSYEKNPKHNYFSKGNYLVELTVSNEEGCTNTYSEFINIEETNKLLAPDGFTPDGNGINDDFIPKGLEIMDVEFEMFIYDKSGSLVYKTNDYSKPWNGTFNNIGQSYPTGSVFMWVVITKDKEGVTQNHLGNITIVK